MRKRGYLPVKLSQEVTWASIVLPSAFYAKHRHEWLKPGSFSSSSLDLGMRLSAVQSYCSILSHDALHYCLSSNSSLENSERELGHLSATAGSIKTP